MVGAKKKTVETWRVRLPKKKRGTAHLQRPQIVKQWCGENAYQDIASFVFNSFFTSSYLPSILEVERTSIALNADDVR